MIAPPRYGCLECFSSNLSTTRKSVICGLQQPFSTFCVIGIREPLPTPTGRSEPCGILDRFCFVVYLSHMATRTIQTLKQLLNRLPGELAHQEDTQLLRQFSDQNDHQAFEVLLDRHGPMVLGTARRLIGNTDEADDIFQAVFLSLTRLAKTIRHGQSIPNWLYMATCRIAARMRKRRDLAIENAPEPSTAARAEADLVWREVRTALDEELKRLPERLRHPSCCAIYLA